MASGRVPQVKRTSKSSVFGLLLSLHYSYVFLEILVVASHAGSNSVGTPKGGGNGISYMYAFFHSGT